MAMRRPEEASPEGRASFSIDSNIRRLLQMRPFGGSVASYCSALGTPTAKRAGVLSTRTGQVRESGPIAALLKAARFQSDTAVHWSDSGLGSDRNPP